NLEQTTSPPNSCPEALMPAMTFPSPFATEPKFPPQDRRLATRRPSNQDTFCQPVGARRAGDWRWPTKIRDISATGISLLLSRRFEPGTILVVEAQSTSPGEDRLFLARVIHTTPQGGEWVVGCEFVNPPSDDEVDGFR